LNSVSAYSYYFFRLKDRVTHTFKTRGKITVLSILILRFYAARRNKAVESITLKGTLFFFGGGGARKVSSNCIILEVKIARRRWKQLASLICVMNNAQRSSMGLKRTPQGVYQVALSVSVDLCSVAAYTNQHDIC
jgi:hypothetical protein